jgi:hypothetical protein
VYAICILYVICFICVSFCSATATGWKPTRSLRLIIIIIIIIITTRPVTLIPLNTLLPWSRIVVTRQRSAFSKSYPTGVSPVAIILSTCIRKEFDSNPSLNNGNSDRSLFVGYYKRLRGKCLRLVNTTSF